MGELTKYLEEKARLELGEVPEEREEHINHIKHWIKQHCGFIREDELWILNFLRGCKFDLEKTKSKLELYNRLKTTAPEFFSNQDPFLPEIQDILSRGVFIPISDTYMELLIMRWENVDSDKNLLVDILKVGLMLLELYLKENSTIIIKGIRVIDDCKGFPLTYIKQTNISLIKNACCLFFKALPTRFKNGYIINSPYFVNYVLKVAKLFLSKKLSSRVHVYKSKDFCEIYKDIPLSIFPKEYGGQGESIETIKANLKKKMESHREWFLKNK